MTKWEVQGFASLAFLFFLFSWFITPNFATYKF